MLLAPRKCRAFSTCAASTWIRPDSFDYLQQTIESRAYEAAVQTPLTYASGLSKQLASKCSLFLKREDLQTTFSFNVRGAHNKIASLTEIQRRNGIVACAAGNHLHGVAYSATKLGISARMIVPIGSMNHQLSFLRNDHIEIVEQGHHFEDAMIAQNEGRAFIHPFDDPMVIAGNGTVGMEILRQMSGKWPDAIFVPVGGGGLIAGIAAYVKRIAPNVSIIGVEESGANLLQESCKAKKRVRFTNVNCFTNDVAMKQIGQENFRICTDLVDKVITVSTDEICSAIRDVFEDTRSLMEPLGALSVAGVKKYAGTNGIGKKYVAILAAANMDFDRLRFISERSDDRERIMSVQIPERRGAFQQLYDLIFPYNVTEFTYRMVSQHDIVAQIHLSIQTKTESEFHEVLSRINSQKEMQAIDQSQNELTKAHLRYLGTGRAQVPSSERVFRMSFPERPGALKDFLDCVSHSNHKWNISLFHYRNHGADIGRVLVAFQVPPFENEAFEGFLRDLNFAFYEETQNPAYQQFLL